MRSNSKIHSLFQNLRSIFFSFIIAASPLLNHSGSDAQELFAETGICACTPSIYDFQLDVWQGCPTAEAIDLILDVGIESAECAVVSTKSDDIKDLVPVSVHTITVEELKQDNTIAVSQSVKGDFRDGDAFRYISISSDLEDIKGAVDLPKTLRFKISGKNQDDQDISNIIVVSFTNDCEIYPVIQADHTAGWIRFLEPFPPLPEICTAYSSHTPSPSSIPSDVPSLLPSSRPSAEESAESSSFMDPSSPSPRPSSIPSDFPSLMPSLRPSMEELSERSSLTNPSLHAPRSSSVPSDFPSLMPSSRPPGEESPVDSSLIDMECSMCSQLGECIQSPHEIYPNINNTVIQVTCGQVEKFALFSNSLTPQECDLLKSSADKGVCGGCGTSNCASQNGVSYAAPKAQTLAPTPSPSVVPSSIPRSIPVLSFPTSFPTFRPTVAVPSAPPTGDPSAVPSTKTPLDLSSMEMTCNVCAQPGECIQSPHEMYPSVNNTAMLVTCGQVEQYALFSNSLTVQECELLKSHANDGVCGGCGTSNCNSHDKVSYAAPPIPTPLPSIVPSGLPSSIPTTSFPTSFPTFQPTTAEPSGFPSSIPTTSFPTSFPTFQPTTAEPSASPTSTPSTVPSARVPSQTSSIISDNGPLSTLYDMPPEWTEDAEILVSCALCPVGCAQSPDELFPNMEEGMEVSCGAVEDFVLTSGISMSYCTLLKTYLFLGSCGGCGTENCS